jgi:signal transduction histidine kinase
MDAATHEWSADPKREATAALARAQAELEHAVEELGRLPALDVRSIALASHALTNFLSVTSAVVDLLIPVLREHPDRQVSTWLDGLAHATSLMSHTVSQLMNSSVGFGTTLRIEAVDLSRLVERACAYYRPAAERKSVAIQFRAGPEVPEVRTDRVLVAAVLDSLLSNAVRHAPQHTRVTVEVRAERDGVSGRVRDEGTALSREDVDLVFASPARGEPPLGYGLAVAKRFVDQLGGEIRCDSGPGKGTTITLWLPNAPWRE